MVKLSVLMQKRYFLLVNKSYQVILPFVNIRIAKSAFPFVRDCPSWGCQILHAAFVT